MENAKRQSNDTSPCLSEELQTVAPFPIHGLKGRLCIAQEQWTCDEPLAILQCRFILVLWATSGKSLLCCVSVEGEIGISTLPNIFRTFASYSLDKGKRPSQTYILARSLEITVHNIAAAEQ